MQYMDSKYCSYNVKLSVPARMILEAEKDFVEVMSLMSESSSSSKRDFNCCISNGGPEINSFFFPSII